MQISFRLEKHAAAAAESHNVRFAQNGEAG